MNEQYSKLTLAITESLSKQEKKDYGIFITPRTIIESLFNIVLKFAFQNSLNLTTILEPSCGTCEIIQYLDEQLFGADIMGVEYNETIYNAISGFSFKNNVMLKYMNFMDFTSDELFNLIIGNPPYFVCKKDQIPDEFSKLISGRPNIFGLFILKSLSLLKPKGLLAFVVPKSFLNSIYYAKIRNYIKKTCTIISIQDYTSFNLFIDTEQTTCGIVLQKLDEQVSIPIDCAYSVKINDSFIFTDNSIQLKQLFEGSTTISKLGLKVRTGKIVWNQHKVLLTDNEEDTLLIYNTNISKDNKLVVKKFKNKTKGQYINCNGRNDMILVVNRGNGNSKYKLNYAVVEKGPYLVENHLNEIYSPNIVNSLELKNLYEKITNSFKNPKTQQFINLFLGNNGLSKTELETIFPIYE
jgi:adenine-specific DNA-methyltransferase